MFELTGQVSIVTGGGSGIGRQVCRTLATAGSKVACLDIDGERAKETVELISKEGGECFATKLDVSKNAEVLSAVKSVISRFGAIHILVNNAGITGVVNPLLNPELAGLENIEEQEWEKVMAINLKGAFLFIKAVIPHMKSKKYGRIVNISSRLGKSGAEFIDAAQEYGQYGITVNAVAPSMIKGTGMTSWLTKELEQKLVRKVPLGRLGKTSDVAFAVLFLCSKEAGFITGHTLDVNGGILMD